MQTEADSEIPYLGLDSGRLNIDCDINPVRLANAAAKVARTYGKYRQERKGKRRQSHRRRPIKSSSTIKRKRTRISLDTDYEKARNHNDDDDGDGDGDGDDDAVKNKHSSEEDN